MAGQIPQGSTYTVQSGDTLSDIAQRAYGNGSPPYWMALYFANQSTIGDSPDHIYQGESLFIPAISDSPASGHLYVVKQGDAFFDIVKSAGGQFVIIYPMIMQMIGNNPNLIYPGQILWIPTGVGNGEGFH